MFSASVNICIISLLVSRSELVVELISFICDDKK
jgi:hypothetical protein